jgi:hypothetical protein
MKAKAIVVLVLALALAAPGFAAKGKPTFQRELAKLGMTCPRTTLQLRGTFGGAGDGFMAVEVSKATGKAAKLAGKQVAVRLLHTTRITRGTKVTVAPKLKTGNRLTVVALFCSQGLVARTVAA